MSFTRFPNLRNVTRPRVTTPSFNPNTKSPFELELEELLKEQEQEKSFQPQKQNFISRLLSGIPQALGVALSDNPGQALVQQLAQQQANNLEIMKMQQESEERRRNERQQVRMERLRQLGQKEQTQTEITARKEEKQLDREQDILLTDIKFTNDKELQAQHNTAAAKLQELRLLFESSEGQTNREWREKMLQEEIKGDIKQVEIKSIMGALLHASKYKGAAPVGDVMRIVDKLANGTALTKDDTNAIDKAMKIQLMVVGGGVGTGRTGGSSGNFPQGLDKVGYRQLVNGRNEIIKKIIMDSEVPVTNEDGSISYDIMTNKPNMRVASPEEMAQKIVNATQLYDAAVGLRKEEQAAITQSEGRTTGKSSTITEQELTVMNNIRQAFSNGVPEKDILTSIETNLKGNPALQRQAKALIQQRKQRRVKLPWER